MTPTENLLRAVRFETPEYVPMRFGVGGSCWAHYPREALVELMLEHSLLFPGFRPPGPEWQPTHAAWRRAGQPHTDSWGCVWETNEDGTTGAVTQHPLASWDAFADYRPPDPGEQAGWGAIDWNSVGAGFERARANGGLCRGSLRHGHTFLTLSYVRGYENVLFDMADDDPRLHRLIGMVESFNLAIVRRYVELGADWMGYPEDLGMQVGPLLSPAFFRAFIKPVYERLMAPAREAGCVIHMHSDGDIRALVPDLVDSGVSVLNLQDLVNGVDWIRDNLKGRVCIDLDVDRQNVVRFGRPSDVDDLIRREVETLGSPEGGLMLTHGLYPGVPLENVKALMDAMERYATTFS